MEENKEAQGGQYDVKDTGDVLVLVGSALKGVDGALADGKIGMEDLGQIMLIVPHIGPAVDGFANIPNELDELDEADKATLKMKVDTAFGDGAFEKVGKELFNTIVHAVAAYNAIKAI